jgi:hypothetical protein
MATQAYTGLQGNARRREAVMNGYSVLTNLLRSSKTQVAAVQDRPPVLLPRTAADELPPYREQPWIIDGRGYRKIDPSMTLVPVSRL